MKILKIISVVSFLLVFGIQEVGLPIFISIPYMMVNLLVNIPDLDSWLLGLFAVSMVWTLITLFSSKKYKDLVILCFIALLMGAIYLTGTLNPKNYERITLWFVIPLSIFIISSVLLIISNFRKPDDGQE